jgi:pimeloyl-ACP methyl ester carboxylesterase
MQRLFYFPSTIKMPFPVRGNAFNRLYSWHEMGIYDVPATIDLILNVTGTEKLYYVGHSMGTTQFFVTMSELPDYNDKIYTAFLMAPSAYLSHSMNTLRFLSPLAYNGQVQSNVVKST